MLNITAEESKVFLISLGSIPHLKWSSSKPFKFYRKLHSSIPKGAQQLQQLFSEENLSENVKKTIHPKSCIANRFPTNLLQVNAKCVSVIEVSFTPCTR